MGTLQAGTATVNITPELGCHLVGYFADRIADHIHDELLVKAIVLTDGETTLGLVTCDLISLPVATVNAAKALIEERTGIAPANVLISATHTHTAPSAVGALGTPGHAGVRRLVGAAHRRCLCHGAEEPSAC